MHTNRQITIGLEIHAALKTNQKLFSSSDNAPGLDEPNTKISPLDLGMPGALPILDPQAVAYAVRTCLALGMQVRETFSFDRKAYVYPDLPLGYQITQFYEPIGINGSLAIYVGDTKKNIRIRQIHMETDAGKSLHQDNYTLLDFNRCGSPLLEIVTQPDFKDAEEVIYFIRILRSTLKHINVSDASMELGEFRVDVNISISNKEDVLGSRVEMKNLNSFRSIRKAIEAEYNRQSQILDSGGLVKQETRSFDEKSGETLFLRSKETSEDYLYFPEPDLPRFILHEDIILNQQSYTTEIPSNILDKINKRFGIKENFINLVEEPFISRFVQAALDGLSIDEQKQALKLIFGDIFARLKEDKFIPINHFNFRKLVKLVISEQLNATIIKAIMDEMWDTDQDPNEIIENKGLRQITNPDLIRRYAVDALKNNPNELSRYLDGKHNLRAFFIGQVMKVTQNRVNAGILNRILDEELKKRESN